MSVPMREDARGPLAFWMLILQTHPRPALSCVILGYRPSSSRLVMCGNQALKPPRVYFRFLQVALQIRPPGA
jgi:hypothetical protein